MKRALLSLKYMPLVGALLLGQSVSAATTLTQQPLFLTSGAEPNIMFVLDDSGSMGFEMTPESYVYRSAVYAFPSPATVYGVTRFNSKVVAPGSQSLYGKLYRSQLNRSYYNPAKQYLPWISTDGVTRMANASPSCAFHNPVTAAGLAWTGTGESNCRNLTVNDDRTFGGTDHTWVTCTAAGVCADNTSAWTYYPATYYHFLGVEGTGDVWLDAKYQEQQIISTTTSYSGHGRTRGGRPDCASGTGAASDPVTCTYADEIKNFANWYTYYRSRVLTARAGIGFAFARQEDDKRVGFGAINNNTSTDINGVSTTVISKGVEKFTSGEKTSFLTALYAESISGGTPLPNALFKVGTYFERSDNGGPWGKIPKDKDPTPHYNCRASYALLMSDGYWNSALSATDATTVGNSDNTAGVLINNDTPKPDKEIYPYLPSYQYAVADPYKDEQTATLADIAMHFWKRDLRDLKNRVPVNDVDPAFWQHMTTFTIGLGVKGNITPTPDVTTAIKTNQSITWPTIVTSTSDGTKVDDMVHAAINGHGDFFSATDPDEFADKLSELLDTINKKPTNNASAAAANSTSLNQDSVVYQALFSSEDWSGELKATALNANGSFGALYWSASVPAEGARKIFSWNNAGIQLTWDSLSVDQQNYLKAGGDDDEGKDRLAWFRGVDNTVSGDPFDLRDRKGKRLGDIINSDPAYAGRNDSHFEKLHEDLGGHKYRDFYTSKKKNRREMIYVGANDGMMHAFNATRDNSDSVTDGEEMFAYVPSASFSKVEDLSSESYGETSNVHKYSVDGPIYIGDAYIGGDWKNLLVGTLGAGGKGIYVLDITNPDSFGASNVLFELTDARLGNIMGMAIIAPGADNRWKIFVGNGYNSNDSGDKAVLAVIDIEEEYRKAKGEAVVTSYTQYITVSSLTYNGLAQPALLADKSGVIKYAYAGDLKGNLWKFDLSSTTAGSWSVAYSGTPLYVAKDPSNNVQPITSSPTLGFNPLMTPASVMVYFGTGRYLNKTDVTDKQLQSFYGIADKTTGLARSDLHQKSFTAIGVDDRRDINNEVVDWTTKNGWYFDFPAGERLITKPLLLFDRLVFPTIVPDENPCNAGGTGWLMELQGLGDNPDYCLLCANGNLHLDIPVYGRLTSVEGVATMGMDGSASSASSASAGSSSAPAANCPRGVSATVALIAIRADGSQQAAAGNTNSCDLGRQSWRQLQ